MAYVYTSRSQTEPGSVPSGWGDNPYPGLRHAAYPTTAGDGASIPGFSFPNGFQRPNGLSYEVAQTAPAQATVAANAITISVQFHVTNVAAPATALLNHLLRIRAKNSTSGTYTTLKLAGATSYQDALWLPIRKYETATPKYGAYESITVNVTGYNTATDDAVLEADIPALDPQPEDSDNVDLT